MPKKTKMQKNGLNKYRYASTLIVILINDNFFEQEFNALITHNKFDLKNMSFILPYLATQVHTAIHNNLKEHFITRLYRFINTTVTSYEQDLSKEKKKHNIIEKETKLSDKNSKTVDYQKFKDYLIEKNKLNASLRAFYQQELFRKLKWRRFVYTLLSEDKFLNNIEQTFGSSDQICIAYGDWSRSSQMKHFMPAIGVGLRKLIAKKFMVVMVNEFRTSKLCCCCHKELCHMEVQKENKTKKLFRCLVCKGCVSSESKKTAFVTRDLNSAINIRNLAHQWVHHQTRPSVFSRTEGLASTSASEEKVSQSVDFTVGKATDP